MANGRTGSAPPSSSWMFHRITSNKKSPRSPWGNKDRIYKLLRYHLACRRTGRLITVPTHRLPLTQALRQKILRPTPFPPALSGPFAAPLFAPLSAPGTLCGRALQLYFRLNGLMQYRLTTFNHNSVRLSSTFFFLRWIPPATDYARRRFYVKIKNIAGDSSHRCGLSWLPPGGKVSSVVQAHSDHPKQPSPLGRVPPKGAGEALHKPPATTSTRRIRNTTTSGLRPPSPQGEGFPQWRRISATTQGFPPGGSDFPIRQFSRR